MPEETLLHTALEHGDPTAWRETLKLSRGSERGVAPGAAVAYGARLIGRVTRAGPWGSDASLLGAMADGCLLVVRLRSTPRHYVEQTHNMLESLGANVLGTCLTGAAQLDTSKGYSRSR